MAAITNLTNLTNVDGFYELVEYTDNTTHGAITVLFIVSLFFIFMMLLIKRYEPEESFLAASFFCTMISMFMVAIDLLNFIFIIVFAIMMGFSALYVYMVKR